MKSRALLPALVWACIVLVLCGIPGTKLPELSFWQWLRPDKIVHLVLFGTQSFLLLAGFSRFPTDSVWRKHAVLLAIGLSVVYGGTIEWMQDHVFIQRSGDLRDALANALGALLGGWLFRKFEHKLPARFRRGT